MTAIQELPQVHECSVDSCAFHADAGCHAGAITIGGEHAHCNTFIDITPRAGGNGTARVGACHRIDCVHNSQLACGAPSVSVGQGDDVADCLTFSAR